MREKQVYSYSKKSRWRNIRQVALYIFVPLFLFMLLLSIWGNFFLDLEWEELLSRLGFAFRLLSIAAVGGLVLGTFVRSSLRFELDSDGISSMGWGRIRLMIPYNEISEIRVSKFDVVQIKSEQLKRTIFLSPSHFEPEEYAELKASLERWKKFTPITENELTKPLSIWGGLALYGILCPVLLSSSNPVVKALPFFSMFILAIVIIVLGKIKQEAPNSMILQLLLYICAALSGLTTVLVYLGDS